MVYIEKRGEPVAVMIPANTDGTPSGMTARSTVGLEEYEVLSSDLGTRGSYWLLAVSFPPSAQYGEYEYALRGSDGGVLSTGIAVLVPPEADGGEYNEDVTFSQYGG